ncbi:MAG: helix-turn-helix domain-containing protein [Candidatus Saccharibacteria bacterium]
MIKEALLEQAGLNQSEVKVYKRLLEYGELAPPRLSELTGLARQNTYAALKTLTKKELIEVVSRRKKLAYQVQHPNKLVELVDKQIDESKMVQKSLKANMPELISLFSLASSKPGIIYFDGLESIKNIYLDGLRSKPEEVLVFRSTHDDDKLGVFLTSFKKRRALNGTKTKMISQTIPTKEKIEEDKQLLIQRKYVPDDIFHLDTEIAIADNQVSFITFDKQIKGFVITSKEVAQTLRTIFESLWVAEF